MRRFLAIFCVFALLSAGLARVHGAEQKRIALTFDDGPNGKVTERILDLLEKEQVPATFFVLAEQAERYPALLVRMHEQGHEIGLHGVCHCYMNTMSQAQVEDELCQSLCTVSESCGVRPRLLRPPGGRVSETLLSCAKQEHLAVILWSIDTLDWNKLERRKALGKIRRQAADGQIILMHDLLSTSCEIAEQTILYLKSEGYTFCTVSELLGGTAADGAVYYAAVDGRRKNA